MTESKDFEATLGKPIRIVVQSAGDSLETLKSALGISPPPAVLLIAGGADTLDPKLIPKLTQLIGRGLVRAAREVNALCVDGGTDAGVMALFGRAVDETGSGLHLLGVAPAAKVLRPDEQPVEPAQSRVPLEPHHSHFVLTQGADWGAETPLMYDLVQALVETRPVIVVVIGGGARTLTEVLHAVRHRWPVLIIEGSKGAADELAAQWRANVAEGDDPIAAEILADGNLSVCSIDETAEILARRIRRELGGDSTLRQAWVRFGAIDLAAAREQKSFRTFQAAILALGVLVVFLAILQDATPAELAWKGIAWKEVLHYVVLAIPIVLSVLIAGTNRFRPGNRWVLMRAAAEAIKCEIFQYRVRTDGYRDEATREKTLAQAVEDATRRLARTEANTTALRIYGGPIPPKYAAPPDDDGLSPLTPDRYIQVRLDDQLAFMRGRTATHEKLLQRLQWIIIGAGGVGTFLAALHAEIWIALTTAVTTALATYLGYRQVEATLTTYNQTATDLDNIKGWWIALQPQEQGDPANIQALVQHTEQALKTELAGWANRMQDALAQLRKAQEKQPDEQSGDTGTQPAAGAEETDDTK